jgi:hypothetical protein
MTKSGQEEKTWESRIKKQFSVVLSRIPKQNLLPHHQQLRELSGRVTETLAPLVNEFQTFLVSLADNDLGSAPQKKALIDEIQLMMDLLNCRCECPKCGTPASIRFRVAGAKQEERFDFQHSRKDGRGGSCTTTTKLPILRLCALESPSRKSDPGPSL